MTDQAMTRDSVEFHAAQILSCLPENIKDHVDVLLSADAALREELAVRTRERDDLLKGKGVSLADLEYPRLKARLEHFQEEVLGWRGIEVENVCKECGGAGSKAYGNTSTYHYGAGGQMITISVCDKCWGSGDSAHPWMSWRKIEGMLSRIAELEKP
jgi:hypothetical protein